MITLEKGTLVKDRYSLIKLIGRGGCGEVWYSYDTLTDHDVALKFYLGLNNDDLERFKLEYVNIADISSRYIMRPDVYEIWNNIPFLVMRYCAFGASSLMIGNVNEDFIWKFINHVSKGLQVLHQQDEPIVHLDIKPDNILVDSNYNFCISDFGISRRLSSGSVCTKNTGYQSGAIPYMAPERFKNPDMLFTASDIWSLGVSIYELAMGELPFNGFGGKMQANRKLMPNLSNKYSESLNRLMQRCLSVNPENRITATKLVLWSENHRRSNRPEKKRNVFGKFFLTLLLSVFLVFLFYLIFISLS